SLPVLDTPSLHDALPISGLKKMLAAVSGDIAAEFCRGDRLLGRIFCPEYQEVLDENTPAHIFNRNIEGIGYRYRQCFTDGAVNRSEEHTSELQSRFDLVC